MSVSLVDGHIDRESRMTDKEIIKALKKHSMDLCSNCKVEKTTLCNDCISEIERNALDLINRQQSAIDVYMQENDRLKTAYIQVSEDRNEIRKETEAEIEKLEKHNKEVIENCLIIMDKAEEHYNTLYEEAKEILIAEAKSEAIKEFAERLKDDSWFTDLFDRNDYPVRAVTKEDIDNLAKEMVGEDK